MTQIVELESSISAVEVFRSQALVTRRAGIELAGKSGRLVAELAPLPYLLRDDSLRLKFDEPGAARLVDVHIELLLGKRAGPLRTAAEEELQQLARQRLAVEVEREREQDLVRSLRSLKPAERDEADLPEKIAFGERNQVEAWLELSNFVGEQLDQRLKAVRKLNRQLEQIDDSIARAYDRLQAESRARAEELAMLRKSARLVLELNGAHDSLGLELSYLVPAARWVPAYELRVEHAHDRAELVCKALVAQRSGEDWTRTGLAFSTADLNRSADLPELDSWRIGKAQPPKPSGWRELPDTIGELFAGYDRDLGSLPEPDIPALPDLPRSKRLGRQPEDKKHVSHKAADMLLRQIVSRAKAAPPPPPPAKPRPSMARHEAQDLEKESVVLDEECDICGEMETGEAFDDMPMEAAMAPPAPEAVMARKAPLRRSAGIMRSVAAAVTRGAKSRPGGGAPPAGAIMPAEPEQTREYLIQASAAALSFADLRMRGPQAGSQRGQLMAASPRDKVAEQLGQAAPGLAGMPDGISPEMLLEQAAGSAEALYGLSLPEFAVPLSQSAGHFAARYPMESPGSVPADGRLHALTLLRRDGQVRRVFRCVPRTDTNVYQLAEFENPLGLPLLAGAVQVYSGGDFVVESPMQTTPPAKTITVNLGVEQGITVARNTAFSETVSGLLGGDTELRHKIDIEVHNKLARSVRLEVFERIPTSRDDDIKVKLISSTPKAESYDQTDRGRPVHGGWKFSLELNQGQKTKCSLEYQITISSKQVLSGGNRRD